MLHRMGKHLAHVVEFSFAVPVRVEEALVNDPELRGLRVDIDTGDNPDAANHRFGVAAI